MVRPSTQLVWAGLSLASMAVAFLASFGMVITLISNGLVAPRPNGLRLDLALWLACFAALALIGVVGAARLAFRRWPTVQPRQLAVPLAGVAIAVGEELALHEWAEASIGAYDWDFIGVTAGLSLALVVLSVAALARAIAPVGASAAPTIGLSLAAAAVLLIIATNVPAVVDGIGPHSWPLAILVGAAAAYAIATLVRVDRAGAAG